MTDTEGANQVYCWYTFIARSLKQGLWPVWDPYTFSGHSFAGEMQTAAFFPLNLILAVIPLNRHGLFSPSAYHYLYAVAHLLGAYFMFLLGRALGLRFSASLLAGVCFSLGGFTARVGAWPHMYWGAIWLPLILLLVIKAFDGSRARAVACAALSGLALGMVALAGGLHVVIMDGIVLVSAVAAYVAFGTPRSPALTWKRGLLIAGIAVALAATSSAVQLLPSMEYTDLARRWISGGGTLPAAEKIPYDRLDDGLQPSVVAALLFPVTTGVASGEYINPYLGVFPVLLAAIGIWKKWHLWWVRYFAGLALAALLYAMGSLSLLHGLAYAIIPKLWIAREANRFVYLTDFALALLAGYGWTALMADSAAPAWEPLKKMLRWVLLFCALALLVPAIYGKPELGSWHALSLLLIAATCGLALVIIRGRRSSAVTGLVFALLLFDLHAFDWGVYNIAEQSAQKRNHLERLLSFENAAAFLKSQPGMFRVDLDVGPRLNAGDLFAIPANFGAGVTITDVYDRIRSQSDLLNVRYIVKPASTRDPGPVYHDPYWKIYERPAAYPRAWLVHDVAVEPSADAAEARLKSPGFDGRTRALLSAPPGTALEPAPDASGESVEIRRYEPNTIEMVARAAGKGLLVASESFYPGWTATVDGRPAAVHQVDVGLRGVVVPRGESRIVFHYAPASVRVGAILSLASFCVVAAGLVVFRRRLTS